MRGQTVYLLASFALVVFAQPVIGGPIPFYDDFEDGDYADGNPVLWNRAEDGHGDLGTREVIDGSLVMSGTNYSSIWVDDTLNTTDVSLRASVRFADRLGTWLFAARSDSFADEFYWGGINATGYIWIGDWAAGSGIITRNEKPTNYDPTTEDVSLRMDVYDVEEGVELSLYAWGEGETMSTEPQLRYTDDDGVLFEEGMVGMFVQQGSPTTVAIRYFEAVPKPVLVAGDADENLLFDQLDLMQVQLAGKYLTGEFATWGEGDWNGAPGGSQGAPPPGDRLFNQLDIVAAQQAAAYLTGPYAANSPVAVPEPSGLVLFALGLVALSALLPRQRHEA